MQPTDPRMTLTGKRIEFEEIKEILPDGGERVGFRLVPAEGQAPFEIVATKAGFTLDGKFTVTTHPGLSSLAELMGKTYKMYKRLSIKEAHGTLGAPKVSDTESREPTKSGLIL